MAATPVVHAPSPAAVSDPVPSPSGLAPAALHSTGDDDVTFVALLSLSWAPHCQRATSGNNCFSHHSPCPAACSRAFTPRIAYGALLFPPERPVSHLRVVPPPVPPLSPVSVDSPFSPLGEPP